MKSCRPNRSRSATSVTWTSKAGPAGKWSRRTDHCCVVSPTPTMTKRSICGAIINFGVEVYRDIDENFNGKADQYRWLSTGGIRWGLDDDEDGRIDRWKKISAEEVTAEVVAALRDRDAARFSPAADLGIRDRIARIGIEQNANRSAPRRIAPRRTSQGWHRVKKRWARRPDGFSSPPPHPASFPAAPKAQPRMWSSTKTPWRCSSRDQQSGQLMVGTLIQVGDAWRLVELPSVGDGETVAQTTGNFFTPGGGSTESAACDVCDHQGNPTACLGTGIDRRETRRRQATCGDRDAASATGRCR